MGCLGNMALQPDPCRNKGVSYEVKISSPPRSPYETLVSGLSYPGLERLKRVFFLGFQMA